MSATSPRARAYRKLTSGEDAELKAAWEAGASTVADLSTRFGMSARGIQAALVRLVAQKGAGAAMVVRATERIAYPAEISPGDDLGTRAAETRDDTYRDAHILQRLAMKAATEAAEAGGMPALRGLDLAATIVERCRKARWAATGLDKTDLMDASELPELIVRELSDAEVAAMRAEQLDYDQMAGAPILEAMLADDQPDVIEGES